MHRRRSPHLADDAVRRRRARHPRPRARRAADRVVDVDATRDEPPLWWCDVKVAPDVDAGEVVAELVAWLEERAEEGRLRRLDVGGGCPHRRRLCCARVRAGPALLPDGDDLADDEREPAWPDGISVRTVTAEDHRSVYDAVVEVWRDTNDPIDDTFEEWAHWHVERDSYDPSLWFLAQRATGWRASRSAGPIRSIRRRASQSARGAPAMASTGSRRGAVAALVRGVPAEGLTRGTLGVDASSVTGATRLYERAGMSVYRDTVFLERPVAGASRARAPPAAAWRSRRRSPRCSAFMPPSR